jgi:hypothetical protein
VVDQRPGRTALCQQGFHLSAQVGIILTGFGEEAISLLWSFLQGRMVKLLDLLPAFGVHGALSG